MTELTCVGSAWMREQEMVHLAWCVCSGRRRCVSFRANPAGCSGCFSALSKDGELASLCMLYVFFPLHHLHEGKFCILNILINCKNILNWVQLWCPFLDLGKMSRINVSCVMGQQSLILQGRDWKSLLSRLWRDCELLGLYKEVHSECVSRAVKYVTWQSSLKHLSLSGIGFDRDCLCK